MAQIFTFTFAALSFDHAILNCKLPTPFFIHVEYCEIFLFIFYQVVSFMWPPERLVLCLGLAALDSRSSSSSVRPLRASGAGSTPFRMNLRAAEKINIVCTCVVQIVILLTTEK